VREVCISTSKSRSNAHLTEISSEGDPLLRKRRYSIHNILKEAYPEHEWFPWKFADLVSDFWDSVDNQHLFLSWVMLHDGIYDIKMLESVPRHRIIALGGLGYDITRNKRI
jgi:hypothetical protein